MTVECRNVIFRVVNVKQPVVMFHNDCWCKAPLTAEIQALSPKKKPCSDPKGGSTVLKFPGVSLDWLYLGRPEGLSCQIREKLGYGAAHFQLGAVEQKTSQEQRRSPAIQTPQ